MREIKRCEICDVDLVADYFNFHLTTNMHKHNFSLYTFGKAKENLKNVIFKFINGLFHKK